MTSILGSAAMSGCRSPTIWLPADDPYEADGRGSRSLHQEGLQIPTGLSSSHYSGDGGYHRRTTTEVLTSFTLISGPRNRPGGKSSQHDDGPAKERPDESGARGRAVETVDDCDADERPNGCGAQKDADGRCQRLDTAVF